MLDYIKEKIQEQLHADDAFQEQKEEALMNETILECAHLVQELDDLSIEGTEAGSSRPFTKIDIPLEDDVEITAVELDALDGRVLSTPMDATVQESDTVYVGLKTYNDFYQEAYDATTQFQRETDDQFAQRVEAIASKNYVAYKNYCFQEGLYGFDKLSITDDRVPAKVIMECGTLGGKDYSVKLGVDFQSNESTRQIMKKQLDSVIGFRKVDPVMLQEAAFEAFGEKAGVASADDIWNAVTPTRIVVPAVTNDKLFVAIECEIDGTSDTAYLEWSMPVNGGAMHISSANETDQSKLKSIGLIGKNAAIHIESEMAKSGYHAPSRFVQEAIDFGDPDAAPDANPDAPAVSFDAPPADGMEQPAGGDAGTEAPPADGATADAPAEGTDTPVEGTDATTEDPNAAPKEPVDTNNVSDQIAEKISDETQNDANADADLNIDGVDATSDVDAPTDENLDAELGEPAPDDTASTEPADETSDVDFDNMTIDELLAQGQEKMKTMTMQQLKDFLQGGQLPNGEDVGEPAPDLGTDTGVQEAFFLTRGNIGKELDIHLRKALGILNDNEMEIEQLCGAFRKEGKQLNRVVHKASTMKKVFNETECKQLLKLNHCLSDLMTMLRSNIDKGSIMTVKRMIQAFVQEATGVLKMIEQKNNPGKPVQEGFFSNIKQKKVTRSVDKLEKVTGPLPADLKNYLSTKTGHSWEYCGRTKTHNGKTSIISKVIPIDQILNSNNSNEIKLFACKHGGSISYVVADKNYVLSDQGDTTILGDTFKSAIDDGMDFPKENDVESIEAAMGRKIPDTFTKVFKSKEYQTLAVQSKSNNNKGFVISDENNSSHTTYFIGSADYINERFMSIDDSELIDLLRGGIIFGLYGTDDDLIFRDGKVYIGDVNGKPFADSFDKFIKDLYKQYIDQYGDEAVPVQEGFLGNLFRSSKLKAKSVEQICEDLIDMWDVDDSVWNARELSDIVYEKDPMTFHVFIGDWLPESALKCALIVEKCIHDHPAGCNKFKELQEKFENFANRFNDMLAATDDRELTVSENDTLQELKNFIPEMKTTVREFLNEIDQTE